MSFLRPLESFVGMLQHLAGMLVPCRAILFPVVRGRGSMRMRGELVKFSSSLLCVIWHSVFESFGIVRPDWPSSMPRYVDLKCTEESAVEAANPSKRICRTNQGPCRWEVFFLSVADTRDTFYATYA